MNMKKIIKEFVIASFKIIFDAIIFKQNRFNRREIIAKKKNSLNFTIN